MTDTAAGGVNKAQLDRINIGFRELSVTDRDERLAIASATVGRRLSTSKDLTADEASALITALDNAQTLGLPLARWPDDRHHPDVP
jgi:hypothetical protein